jgi:hypothetical protein
MMLAVPLALHPKYAAAPGGTFALNIYAIPV